MLCRCTPTLLLCHETRGRLNTSPSMKKVRTKYTNHQHLIIAERISARLWMRDLFSGCTYVRMYVSVTLRNVNLCSHSEETHWYVYYTRRLGWCFLVMEDGVTTHNFWHLLNAPRMCNAHRHTGAWRSARPSYTCTSSNIASRSQRKIWCSRPLLFKIELVFRLVGFEWEWLHSKITMNIIILGVWIGEGLL